MKKHLVTLIAIFSCLAGFAHVPAGARSPRRETFLISFDFLVKGRHLPAVVFTIERVNEGNPALLAIRDSGGRQTPQSDSGCAAGLAFAALRADLACRV